MLADTLSYYKQDVSRQEALKKAYYTQVLLTPDKLDSKITRRLFTELALVSETFTNSLRTSVILTNSYVSLDLINHIFTVNKQLFSLADKRAKAIKGD
jgi:hypothetical protein